MSFHPSPGYDVGDELKLPEYVAEVRVLRVEPGDTIVVRVPEGTRTDDLAVELKALWPDNEVLIGENIAVTVVR